MRLIKSLYKTCFILAILAFNVRSGYASQSLELPGEPVKIGLLIPDNRSVAARYGAEMAIQKANDNGGFNGHPFKLIIRSMEGPWGTGSKEAVNLVFEENVWALMGSHDGRNAHLVEQVSAKTRIVFLNTWTGDPTLSQAFVPWYFSCVPNDLQQASVLIEEIYNKKKLSKIAVVSDNDYDSEKASASFVKKAKLEGRPEPVQFHFNNSDKDFNGMIDKIYSSHISCIVLFCQPTSSVKIIKLINQGKMNQTVYGSLSLLGETEHPDMNLLDYEGTVLVSSGEWSGQKGLSFQQEFQRIYGIRAGSVAAYSYDGMNVIIEAIRNAGLDREKIRESLVKIKYEGVTGTIQFDEKGNRTGITGLMEIKNGIPVEVER